MINEQENPITNNDFQSTLEGYKDFVTVLINQLDEAVKEKDTDQIKECLNILNDVESMYEQVRMNFFYTEEWNHWEQEQLLLREEELRSRSSSPLSSSPFASIDEFEDSILSSSPSTNYPKNLHSSLLHRRGSISSTTSSQVTFNRHPTTISEELPYLLQAFDEAKQLEQELSTYSVKPVKQQNHHTHQQHNQQQQGKKLQNYDPKKSNLKTFNIPNVGFNNNLLNSIYGLNPKQNLNSKFNQNLHNEID